MKISIRRVKADRLYQIEALDMLCFKTADYRLSDTQLSDAVWWVGYDGDTPTCYAGIEIQDGKAFLSRAGVMPAYRGQGLQKRLIKTRMRYAKKVGVPRLYTYTAPWNSASINALIRCGFRVYSPYTRGYSDSFLWLQHLIK